AELAVVPAEAGQLDTENGTLTLPDGIAVDLPAAAGSIAICRPGRFACFVLQGFGFTAITVDPSVSESVDLIVVRSAHDDWNPLWPYLSDPEFLFFLSLSIGSIIFFARKGKTVGSEPREYSINLVDYLLTLIATRNPGFMQKMGDRETRKYSQQLEAIEIERPIFISGLARSGTTILLERLSTAKGMATHRYRDFPFIMTPIRWNKFLRFFGTKQTPSERPHQDKIKITRDSPDAFEEPIWQHFFPYLHGDSKSHVLSAQTSNEEFETFYDDHLKKILFLRDGSRYLSKGNYNLSRIEYIARLYPDAVFIVPIRHPFTHVDSLVRQHQLFVDYSEIDPKIPNYLRAVGHYEFGPQRLPIRVTDEGASAIDSAWGQGNEALGYAVQWREIYAYVADLLLKDRELAQRIHLVRFEDLCRDPHTAFENILEFTELGNALDAAELAEGIEPSGNRVNMSSDLQAQCWEVVQDVATQFGYAQQPDELMRFSGRPISRRT
ncbi:MAG: sulfotransferase, partial [Pseudomonadota bacterium]